LKGHQVDSKIAMKILLYTYCSTFKVNPTEAQNTPLKLIIEMLTIHGEVKKIEQEEIGKQLK